MKMHVVHLEVTKLVPKFNHLPRERSQLSATGRDFWVTEVVLPVEWVGTSGPRPVLPAEGGFFPPPRFRYMGQEMRERGGLAIDKTTLLS